MSAATSGTARRLASGAEGAELEAAVGALTDGFADDPVMSHLIAAGRRRRMLGLLFSRLCADYLRIGEVWSSADSRGAAVWAPPGAWPIAGRDGLAQLPIALRVFGRRPLRSIRAEIAIVRGLPKRPYWYLDFIGVHSSAHGRGLGSSLLAAKLAELDASAEAAHLTASSARSRDLYARHGFEVFERLELPGGGPPVWRMWREPGAGGVQAGTAPAG